MSFSSLLGNQRLKDNLTSALRQGKLGHFYLICGPVGSGKRTLARLLSAAAMCQQTEKPCMTCPHCRKILSGVHPDVITVEDPEHKTVPVRLVRQMREDMFIRPNEGDRKIYIFPQELGLEGQNALLKILEEPPSYGLFLLICENPEKLLPTVRSRCVELRLQPPPADLVRRQLQEEFPRASGEMLDTAITQGGGFLGQARALLAEGLTENPQSEAFVQALCHRDELGLTQLLVPMEKWKRDALMGQLEQWKTIVQGALLLRCGGKSLSPSAQALSQSRNAGDLKSILSHLEKSITYAQGNVSPAAICGYLAWHLR